MKPYFLIRQEKPGKGVSVSVHGSLRSSGILRQWLGGTDRPMWGNVSCGNNLQNLLSCEEKKKKENKQTKSGQRKLQLACIKFLFLISELADTLPAAFLTLLTAWRHEKATKIQTVCQERSIFIPFSLQLTSPPVKHFFFSQGPK